MKEKDLLVVYNCFGGGENEYVRYLEELENIFWNIDIDNLQDNIRVVISSVLNHSFTEKKIKEKYGDRINFIRYKKNYPVQVTFNKTVLSSIKEFDEEYKSYFYVSSGLMIPKQEGLFKRIIDRVRTNEFGFIHLEVDEDSGLGCLRKRYWEWKEIEKNDINNDFLIAVGDYCNFHIAIINKELKDFYGVPLLDVYGTGGMEGGVSYTGAALRKKNIVLNNCVCTHKPKSNSERNKNDEVDWHTIETIKDWLLWGRSNQDFLNDTEGIDAGLGNYPEWYTPNDYPFVVLPHRKDKYDENYLSTDERLKYAVKRCYFTNKDELDYDKIDYNVL